MREIRDGTRAWADETLEGSEKGKRKVSTRQERTRMCPGSNLVPLSGPFRFPGSRVTRGVTVFGARGFQSTRGLVTAAMKNKVLGLGQPVSRVSGTQIKEAPPVKDSTWVWAEKVPTLNEEGGTADDKAHW